MAKNKTQLIRIVDVVLIGPVMIYAATRKSSLSENTKLLLLGFGVATILYNGNNYLKNK